MSKYKPDLQARKLRQVLETNTEPANSYDIDPADWRGVEEIENSECILQTQWYAQDERAGEDFKWFDCSEENFKTTPFKNRRIIARPKITRQSKEAKPDFEKLHERLYPEAAKKIEYILCAAIWFKNGKKHEHQPKNIETGFVVCGRRHHNCFLTTSLVKEFSEAKKTAEQGFLTSKDRFVDRKEAAQIAFERGQCKEKKILFSEDLY